MVQQVTKIIRWSMFECETLKLYELVAALQ